MAKSGNPKGRQENWHRAKPMMRLLQASLEHGPSPQSPGLACPTQPHPLAPCIWASPGLSIAPRPGKKPPFHWTDPSLCLHPST
ncbi:hypothetical protein LX32DRAFT_639384 [Colletotrichum zoysiae]|uniref:Uncharacterized protein n=1 Tax=Colletotrichum zoysiae TaxID=1216348 RepID=A0AAD9HHA7_9PEZI|nr:hypothetical protein LX32DRAFT_639384 [Colletotrichum zoysiae]